MDIQSVPVYLLMLQFLWLWLQIVNYDSILINHNFIYSPVLLQGPVDFHEQGVWWRTNHRHGRKHGLSRKFAGSGSPGSSGSSVLPENRNFKHGLMSVEYYEHDKPVGVSWIGLMGGAFLIGRTDPESGTVSDKQAFYLYPGE